MEEKVVYQRLATQLEYRTLKDFVMNSQIVYDPMDGTNETVVTVSAS
jgi:hypothetical protein